MALSYDVTSAVTTVTGDTLTIRLLKVEYMFQASFGGRSVNLNRTLLLLWGELGISAQPGLSNVPSSDQLIFYGIHHDLLKPASQVLLSQLYFGWRINKGRLDGGVRYDESDQESSPR